MHFRSRFFALFASAIALSLLTSCGGGGGGGTSGSTTSAPATNFPAIATESSPVGPVVDLAGFNLMPLSQNDSWVYDIADANGNLIGTGNRIVIQSSTDASSTQAKLLEAEHLNPGSITTLVKTNDGVFHDYTTDAELPSETQQQIGLVREYAFPTYAIGEPRVVVRQGVWNEDRDGDGQFEHFRLEYTQVFRGLESFGLPWNATTTAAHFSNLYRLSVTNSQSGEVTGVVFSEEAWLAQNLGPVKFIRHAEDLQGNAVKNLQTWTIRTLTVGGQTLP